MGRLSGKVAVITGGAKGLGAADARLFVEEGAFVAIADTDADEGEALAASLGGMAQFLRADVSVEAEAAQLVDSVMSCHGRLDVFVNNAGISLPGTPVSLVEPDYRAVMAASIDATVFCCKHALRLMRQGVIVNMSSIASIQGVPYSAAYSAAKGAIEAYTRSVAVYCKVNAIDVRCNSVHPSAFDTPMFQESIEAMGRTLEPEVAAQFRARAARGAGDPRDVANLVLFLACDESRYINGQRFVIDNGGIVTPLGVGG
ncbi:SDR family oxidoreductase [Sphingobium sp. JS3065]|uniref:SDR family oxidoreductase n=1 Tax=Sphingobium sp. JS3065 TaxID=2970925 RepID=UPI0022654A9C|nr:SDR family oxidoreductase [Sphingobium sp. JS3065]UZW57526.1 SDR family oxidoreductase [Sphingobium sp. JS3065]